LEARNSKIEMSEPSYYTLFYDRKQKDKEAKVDRTQHFITALIPPMRYSSLLKFPTINAVTMVI
jgi:hypothetical protein